jgi:hypothetical protein
VGPYTIDGAQAGSILCYTVQRGPYSASLPPQSHIEWTDENASIYAHAIRNDLADLSLYEWWLTSSGPRLPVDGTVPVKDFSSRGAVARLEDGTYLTNPRGGCAGFSGSTCALHIDGTSYHDAIDGELEETGDLLMQKPNTVIFSPKTGFCFTLTDTGSTEPAEYTWKGAGHDVTFDRTGGRPLRRTAQDVAARRRVDARPGWRDRRGAGRVDRVRRSGGRIRRVHHAAAH